MYPRSGRPAQNLFLLSTVIQGRLPRHVPRARALSRDPRGRVYTYPKLCRSELFRTHWHLCSHSAALLVASIRQTSYANVKPKRLAALLDKLGRHGLECRDAPSREKGDKRRKEADAVGRLFPGESR